MNETPAQTDAPHEEKSSKQRGFKFDTEKSVESLKISIRNHLRFTLAHDINKASNSDWWIATCMAVRDRVLDVSSRTMTVHHEQNVRRVYYFSLEYLMGRLLKNNLWNAGLFENTKQALAELGKDLDTVAHEENDMGLGNGGLGRLAACFLDSLATLDLPSVGYGIHYEFGLFRQEIVDGRQVEKPDVWARFGNPWQILRPEYSIEVHLYGKVEKQFDSVGDGKVTWVGTKTLIGVPWDIPIVGYGSNTVNFLRLWESRASEGFNLQIFNDGGYVEAVRDKAEGETVSKVLYPNDSTESGKELRLVQQYFFVSCSLRDIIRRHTKSGNSWENFPDKVAIHLNDTHPALAIVELMRILVDEQGIRWDKAWSICQRTFAYTNHTLLPEALEKWSLPLFEKVLPRHLEIILEINRIFLTYEVAVRWPGDVGKLAELSIVEEGYPKMIRMAALSVIGSHSTNGVAALHTKLLKARLFPGFNALYPERFNNKTNGITPRRWLKACNLPLAQLIDETVGTDWPRNLDKLDALAAHADDTAFQERFMAIKRHNKVRLAATIKELCGIEVSPDALFDVQIKRLHEYKRQHLNLLRILTLYHRLLHNPDLDIVPHVFIFAAKAAPGYYIAKNIIHAINAVGAKINSDPRIKDKLKVAFLPNYGVTLAERIIPAADVSEQISTAGKEASGTGNMKLSLNGALTVGTLDGANVEIREEVGEENIFIFGLTVEGIDSLRAKGYNPWDIYWNHPELRTVIDWLTSDFFTGNRSDFEPLRNSILDGGDPFLVLADYEAYMNIHEEVSATYRDKSKWAKMAILNSARMGKFSSDRTIRQYADEIWNLPAVPVA